MELDETNAFAGSEAPTTQADEMPVTEQIETPDEGPIDLDAPEVEATTDEADQPETDEAQPIAPEFADVEIDGKMYKVPAEIRDGYLRTADYTRKTQEVAEMRRQAEARAAQVEQMAHVSSEEIQAKAVLFNLDNELTRFQNTNWQQFMNEDPIEAQAQYMRFQEIKEAKAKVEAYQGQLVQQRGQQYELETANRMKATAEFAQSQIKGWTPELDAKITEFAVKDLGYPLDTLKQSYNPQIYRTLYLAHIGQQALNRQSAAKPTAQPIQPTKTVSAKGSPSVVNDPEAMSMAEYAAYRSAQLRRKN